MSLPTPPAPSFTEDPTDRHAAPESARLPRTTAWPYAGIVSAAAFFYAMNGLVQAQSLWTDGNGTPSTQFVVDHLNPWLSVMIGAGVSLLALVAGVVFLFGLTRFVERHTVGRPHLAEAMRWLSIAFVATGSLGVVIRYITAGGMEGGIDAMAYTPEATATLSVLADQLTTASLFPVLGVMALVGLAAVRDRVFARAVGWFALLLVAVSTGMTLVLGLPYSSMLVYLVFALVVGVSGVLSRKSA